MRTLLAIALAVLALCGTASAQETSTTTYGQDGQPVITQWSGGGYTVYAPDGMTVEQSAPDPITPPVQSNCDDCE